MKPEKKKVETLFETHETTYNVMGRSKRFTKVEVRRKIQEYASKFHNGHGKPETSILNGKEFYHVYSNIASHDELQELHSYLNEKDETYFYHITGAL